MSIRCGLQGAATWFLTGEAIPHVYEDTYKKTTILASDSGFREGAKEDRKQGELAHVGAYLITSKCKYCGDTQYSWCSPEMYLRMGNSL